MAVFRVTSRTWIPAAAKATVRYIKHAHRRQEEQSDKPRQLFGRDGEPLTKAQAYRMIDKAGRNTTFFRIALSPDRKGEDTYKDLDLQALTEVTMMQLQDLFPNQNISYIAAVHMNTDNRHVHILAMIKAKRIPKQDLMRLINTATDAAKAQRRLLDQDRSPAPAPSPNQPVAPRGRQPQRAVSMPSPKDWNSSPLRQETQVMLARQGPSCPNCGPGQEMERRGRRFLCPACGLRMTRGYGLSVTIQQGPGLELSLEGVGET